MKVTGPNASSSSAPVRRSDKSGAKTSAFADALGGVDEPEAATAVGRAAAVNVVDAILALQEVDPDAQSRSRARKRGERLLDRLDDLRTALLTGDLTPQQLTELSATIQEERAQTSDPQLTEILDEIDLRAQVEQAKYDRR
jgi:hypothetical protein